MICTVHLILFCDQTRVGGLRGGGEKGVTSDTYGGGERCVQRLFGRFWHKGYDAIKMDLK
jgi:hypothetical protein